VIYVNGSYTSLRCLLLTGGCRERIKRRLLKCIKLNKVLNADLVKAYNILTVPNPAWNKYSGPEIYSQAELAKSWNIALNLPILSGIHVLQCGKMSASEFY